MRSGLGTDRLRPSKLELPSTVFTLKVTDVVRFDIADLLTVQVVGEQVPAPVAPLLHVPETVVATGEPFCTTAMVTLLSSLTCCFDWSR